MGGDGGFGGCPKEHVIGIIHDLERTNMLHKEIAEKWSVSIEMVQGINTGRYWRYDRVYPIQNHYAYLERQGKKCHIGETWTCIDCGQPVWVNAKRCRACDNKHRVTEKPISRIELKDLIRVISFAEIGRRYSVTINTIKKWCRRFGLPFTKKEINVISDADWLNL